MTCFFTLGDIPTAHLRAISLEERGPDRHLPACRVPQIPCSRAILDEVDHPPEKLGVSPREGF